MKYLFVIATLAALGGCATEPPGPANYGTRAPVAYGMAAPGSVTYSSQPADPHQWHTVSVTPVTLPPDAPRPANVTSEPMVAAAPAQPSVVYTAPAPVVVEQPVIIEEPYYTYPPLSFSLGFGGWRHGGWGAVHYAPRWGHGRH